MLQCMLSTTILSLSENKAFQEFPEKDNKISKKLTYFKNPIYLLEMNYRISRNLEYALMALTYMSERKNQCVSAREMVQVFQCPFHPFSRVLQKLADS